MKKYRINRDIPIYNNSKCYINSINTYYASDKSNIIYIITSYEINHDTIISIETRWTVSTENKK